jgi:protein gp37
VNARPDRLNHWETWRSGPELVFVCSRSDLFHPKIDRDYLLAVFRQFGFAAQRGHTFQVLTKRPERAAELLPGIYAELAAIDQGNGEPWPNVWVGTSIGDNENIAARLAALERIPAAIRWVSAEPLLADVADGMREQMDRGFIDWVVTGGETARPMSKARKSEKTWFKNLRDLCGVYCIPFYFKQWGNYGHSGELGTKQDNGRMLEGEDYKQYPIVAGQPNWNEVFEKRYAIRGRLAQISEQIPD